MPRFLRPARRGSRLPADLDAATAAICRDVAACTMTSAERIAALVDAVRHVSRHAIPGDVVECGVWRGGSMMAAARTLLECGDMRRLHLFDTFAGMPPPADVDRDRSGTRAADLLAAADRETSSIWACSPLDDVRRNVLGTGYPAELVEFVVGRVEQTVPERAPETIAILRLDTDWYESTKHELVHLYPRLVVGGVLIIDDYGHWQGARRAVDEYLAETGVRLLLTRIDATGRIGVKLDP
ncbi:MAG: TylF/MycF/NovP-related O-methyltransferase [Planctomycetaceae bacterium]